MTRIFQILYKLFGDENYKSITLNVTYKVRQCHHLYDGAFGYSKGGVDITNSNERLEYTGETDWSKLEPKGNTGDNRFKYVKKK